MASKKRTTRYDRAVYVDETVGDMLAKRLGDKSTCNEDTAFNTGIMLIMLREIMVNTAIIADHITNGSGTLEYPSNRKGVKNGKYPETDA